MNRSAIILTILTLLTGAIVVPSFTSTPVQASAADVCPGGDNSWSSDWYKDENSPFGVTASGYTIDQICVKGGQNRVFYPINTNDGCWSVSGIGTSTGSAVKVGSGSSCKDISHAAFHRVATTTVTNTPTPTVTPTSTPTVTPTPTDTPTPTPTNTQTCQCDEDEDPTPTPTTVTPTVTVTPTDTTTPTPTTTQNTNNNADTSSSDNTPHDSVQGIQATLGESTMAATGTFTNTLMNLLFAAGMMVVALATLSYAKEKKA